jgi:hypothetical protein
MDDLANTIVNAKYQSVSSGLDLLIPGRSTNLFRAPLSLEKDV